MVVRSERFDYATLYAPKKLQNTPTKRENFDGTLYPPKKIHNTKNNYSSLSSSISSSWLTRALITHAAHSWDVVAICFMNFINESFANGMVITRQASSILRIIRRLHLRIMLSLGVRIILHHQTSCSWS